MDTNAKLAAPAPDPNSFEGRIAQIKDFDETLQKTVALVDSLADRIAGSRPEPPAGQSPSPVPNGLVDTLGDLIGRISIRHSHMVDSLRRIQDCIG